MSPRKAGRRRVFIFGDIDCVINAPGASLVWPESVNVSQTFAKHDTPFNREHITITFAPALVKALDKLRKVTGAIWVWHSTWVETPQSVVRFTHMLGGLYGADMVASPKRTADFTYPRGWKAQHIIRYLEKHGPADFIVLDDEVGKWLQPLEVFAEEHGVRLLPIAPPEDWFYGPGLSPADIEAMYEFIAAGETLTA